LSRRNSRVCKQGFPRLLRVAERFWPDSLPHRFRSCLSSAPEALGMSMKLVAASFRTRRWKCLRRVSPQRRTTNLPWETINA
jgi:hypothetical protein